MYVYIQKGLRGSELSFPQSFWVFAVETGVQTSGRDAVLFTAAGLSSVTQAEGEGGREIWGGRVFVAMASGS